MQLGHNNGATELREERFHQLSDDLIGHITDYLQFCRDEGWPDEFATKTALLVLQNSTCTTITLATKGELRQGEHAKAKRKMLRLCQEHDRDVRAMCLGCLKAHAGDQ